MYFLRGLKSHLVVADIDMSAMIPVELKAVILRN